MSKARVTGTKGRTGVSQSPLGGRPSDPAQAAATAAKRRRTYKIPETSTTTRRARSSTKGEPGFEGSRTLFRTPITPKTHDNVTGTGRIRDASKAKDFSDNLKQHDDHEILDVEFSTSPTTSSKQKRDPPSYKRQKTHHTAATSTPRRHIKIVEDEDPTNEESTRAMSSPNVSHDNVKNQALANHEPIEIDSDQDEPVLSSSPQEIRVVHAENLDTPVRYRPSSPVLMSSKANRAKESGIKVDKFNSMSNSKTSKRSVQDDDKLEYPDSDSDGARKAHANVISKSTDQHSIVPLTAPTSTDKSTPRRNPGSVSTKNRSIDSSLVSPYFASDILPHNTELLTKKGGSNDEEHDPVKSVRRLHLNQQNLPCIDDQPISETFEHVFHIQASGGYVQSRKVNWRLRVSEQGFSFYDQDDTLDKRSELTDDNISSWTFEDVNFVINVTLKEPVRKQHNGRQLYITLDPAEGHRFICMLQHRANSRGTYRKYTGGNDPRRNACISSYETLMQITPKSMNKTKTKSSSSKDVSHISRPDSSKECRNVESPIPITDGTQRQSEARLLANYEAAVEKKPTRIPLPQGRDQNTVADERHLMVGTHEVDSRPVNIADQQGNTQNELNQTRRITRAAEQRSVRDARSSEPLLVYPNIKGQNSVTLYEEDLDRLEPDEFLNDSVVEFYLRYNYDNLSEPQRTSAHVFNTFFYQRLTQKRDRDLNYDAVKKWTAKGKGVDLFSKKFVVIPINENLHWYLAVVVNLDKVIFGDEGIARGPEVSYIQADNEIDLDSTIDADQSVSVEKHVNTTNILDGIDFDDSQYDKTQNESRGDVSPRDSALGSVPISINGDEVQHRISESPVAERRTEDDEIFDFHDEIPPNARADLSLTEKISAGERAKHSHGGGVFTAKDNVDSHALDKLTLEDSQSEQSQSQSIVVGRASKKPKVKKVSPGYSKPGKHITRDTPTIIILDSLNNTHPRVYEIIRDYLVREAHDKKNLILNPKQFKTSKADLPRQDNYSDCGLFLIQYADTLLKEPDIVVPQLLEKTRFNNPVAAQAHKRAFQNMFQIDRIPLRRKEMIDQLKALSIPYRKQAYEEERLRKQERALAMREKTSALEKDAGQDDTMDPEHENSCAVLSTDPMKEKQEEDTPSAPIEALRPTPPLSSPSPPTLPVHHQHSDGIVKDSQEEAMLDSEPPPPPPPVHNRLHNVTKKTLNEDSIDELDLL